MAVQGGLLATYVASSKLKEQNSKLEANEILIFLAAKLMVHILLGVGLGFLGSMFTMTAAVRAVFQGLIAGYMIGVGLAMLDVHPFFRRFLFTTPRFLGRWIRNQSKSTQIITPAVLGAATIVIPCGVTQAMIALAIASASPLWGAAIMGVFVLGTSPLFFVLGMAVARLGEALKDKFRRIAAYAVMVVALFSLNSALVLAGSSVTLQKVLAAAECAVSVCDADNVPGLAEPAKEVTITFLNNRYQVDNSTVKAGEKITLNLVNRGGYGCIQAFEFPALNVSEIVEPGTSKKMEVQVPDKPGKLAFSCSMGMYGGQLTVVN